MRVGSLVYATNQGLGFLAKSFYDHGIVTDVMIVEHHRHDNQFHWYPPSSPKTPIRRIDIDAARKFCRSVDVMLFFETPFEWSLLGDCKRSVLMTMYECTPKKLPRTPDLFLCPSRLDYDIFSKLGHAVFLPVPVEVEWRLREKARTFVHNAGHGGLRGRNGLAELLAALQYVEVKADFVIRAQEDVSIPSFVSPVARVHVEHSTVPWHILHEQGDVCIRPEKFNGLSLPLQEAYAAGMLCMTTSRYPMDTWLPIEPLIPVARYQQAEVGASYMRFHEAVVEPKQIAQRINEWYNRDISEFSKRGLEWSKTMSWEALKPRYLEVLGC